MTNEESFTHRAHRAAVLRQAQLLLRREFVGGEGSAPKDEVTCEDVKFRYATVPQATILEIIQELRHLELREQLEMRKYELRRVDEHGSTQSGGAEGASSQTRKVRQKGRRRDQKGNAGNG